MLYINSPNICSTIVYQMLLDAVEKIIRLYFLPETEMKSG